MRHTISIQTEIEGDYDAAQVATVAIERAARRAGCHDILTEIYEATREAPALEGTEPPQEASNE